MTRSIPRRKRRLLLAAGLALAFAGGTAVVLLTNGGDDETYRPGGPVEGVSAELAREVPDDHPRIAFREVSAVAELRFRHFPGRRTSQLPEDMGSGAAWGDYDRDGDSDLAMVNAGPLEAVDARGETDGDDGGEGGDRVGGVGGDAPGAVLFRNEGDGTFTEVTAAAGIDAGGQGMAAAWADYDGDGWLDLLLTSYGRLFLYRNQGDGTFRDRTGDAGLSGRRGFWAGVAWGDYDRDGDPDLYVTGYVKYRPDGLPSATLQYEVEVPASLNPSSFHPERNLLFRNDGDGSFTEIAEAAGVAGARGRSLEALWCDFDLDGWPDLYVANDVSDNVFYRNEGDGTFRDLSYAAHVADYRGAMGLAAADWDADGDPDLFITHWIAQENALYRSFLREFAERDDPPDVAVRFADVADRVGLGQVALDYVGWATSFLDYDNDGRLDLFVVNGSTFQREDDRSRLQGQRDLLFWNAGPERGFFDVAPASGPYFREERVGRGGAVADFDADGDLDLVVVNHGAGVALLRNEGPAAHGWLRVRLQGRHGAGPVTGARLRLVAGGRSQHRQVGCQASYLSQNEEVIHFGLGDALRVDTLEVRWPSGARTLRVALDPRQVLTLREPAP